METVEPGGLTAGNPTSENPDASEFVLRTPPVTADYRGLLGRAAFVAEHLWQMVSRDTWRESGAFAEGIYEGEVRADEVRQEIEGWKKLAGNASTTETAKPSNQLAAIRERAERTVRELQPTINSGLTLATVYREHLESGA